MQDLPALTKDYIANLPNKVVGIYNPAFDKTRTKIAERRMLTLRDIGERTAAARDLKGFWSQVIMGLEFNGMPFLLRIYLLVNFYLEISLCWKPSY